MPAKYQAILFAPDGDFVTDCGADSIEDVNAMLADLGSRWYFYPFAFVIRDKTPASRWTPHETFMRQRIVDSPDEFDILTGVTVKTAQAFIRDNGEVLCDNLNNNYHPLAGIGIPR